MRRRDEILRTAAELFASDGYTNTSMREVAAASGILAGSLYHHFESKEAIAVELVEAYHADLVRVVREFGSVPVDPLPALRAYAQAIAAVSFRHPAALQISVFDAPTTASSSLKTVVHAEPASVDRLWRTLISAAAAAGAIKDGVDLRILRYVLHRTTLNAGLLWGWQTPAGTQAAAECITALILDGLAPVAPASADSSKATRVVDDARAGWVAEAAESQGQRRGQVLDAARSQFALRGFEATTMRDIADAAGITASNLYRYFESKDSMIHAILGDFSDRLTEAYRDVIHAGSSVVETLDAILWLLDQAGRHFSREIEILQGFQAPAGHRRGRPLHLACATTTGSLSAYTTRESALMRCAISCTFWLVGSPEPMSRNCVTPSRAQKSTARCRKPRFWRASHGSCGIARAWRSAASRSAAKLSFPPSQ